MSPSDGGQMIRRLLRLAPLGLVLLAGVWGFIPYRLPPESAGYPAKGVLFWFSERWRVETVIVHWPRRPGRTFLKDLAGARRPGRDEILPGVGCCGIMLGDSAQSVCAAGEAPTEPNVGMVVPLNGGEVLVHVSVKGVGVIETAKRSARTPEGIGVGSRVRDVLAAYGPEWKDRIGAYGPPEDDADEAEWEEEARYRLGFGWLRKAAIAGAVALIASLVSCLSLSALSREPSWGLFALGHFFLWTLVWMGVLLNYTPFLDEPYADDVRVPLDFIVRMWFKIPLLAGIFLAAFVGFFAAGRLASRVLGRFAAAVYAAGVLGAAVAGTLAGLFALNLGRRVYVTIEYATPAACGEMLLKGAVIPSTVLALCFLLVACQRTRWWETLRLALRLDRPQLEEALPWEE